MSSSVGVGSSSLKVVSCSSSSSTDGNTRTKLGLREQGFTKEASSSSSYSCNTESRVHMEIEQNLKETELRLGLPGAGSPVRDHNKCLSINEESSSSASSELCLLSPRRPAAEKRLFPEEKSESVAASPAEKYPYWHSGPPAPLLQSGYQFPRDVKSGGGGAKRGFSEAMEGRKAFSGGKWAFPVVTPGSDVEASKAKFLQQQGQLTSPKASVVQGSASMWQQQQGDQYLSTATGVNNLNGNGKSIVMNEGGCSSSIGKETAGQSKVPAQERPSQHVSNQTQSSAAAEAPPASKAQVVGWPPIRSFRKNTLAANSKSADDSEGKSGSNALYVKVSMDGAPYLRKVDLKMYNRYQELSAALEKMFSGFTIGQYGSHGIPGRDGLSESKLMDLLHGSEYVLTYEDKDGDWMLVGDVPWEMFVDSCKRLRIMKGSEAIGLAPRAMEKCKSRS